MSNGEKSDMLSNRQSKSRTKVKVGAIVLLLCASAYAAWSWHRERTALSESAAAAPGQPVREQLTDAEIVNRYAQIHYDSATTWKQNRWLGILTQQNPDDVWITQEIITELRPDVILETGTLNGGSAAMWATILVQVNPQGRVISVDIEDRVTTAKDLPIVRERVEYLIGSSTAPEILEKIRERVQDKRVLVILDSDHSRDHVLKELEVYSPFVEVGGYLIVQDSNVNGHPVHPAFGPGPMEAIEAFLESNHDFEVDRSRERLLHTMHPKGYLRRVHAPAAEDRAANN